MFRLYIDTAAKLTGTLNYRAPPALNNINDHVEIFSRSYILAYNIYVNMLYDKYTSRTCDKTKFLAKKWNQLYYCCGELLHCETNAICGETFLWELLMPAIVKPLCFLNQMMGGLHISLYFGPFNFCHGKFFPKHWSKLS